MLSSRMPPVKSITFVSAGAPPSSSDEEKASSEDDQPRRIPLIKQYSTCTGSGSTGSSTLGDSSFTA